MSSGWYDNQGAENADKCVDLRTVDQSEQGRKWSLLQHVAQWPAFPDQRNLYHDEGGRHLPAGCETAVDRYRKGGGSGTVLPFWASLG
jgi:hypothetical protein